MPLRSAVTGAIVTHGEWIGVIMSTRVSYIVYFFDGAVCEVRIPAATDNDSVWTELTRRKSLHGAGPSLFRWRTKTARSARTTSWNPSSQPRSYSPAWYMQAKYSVDMLRQAIQANACG